MGLGFTIDFFGTDYSSLFVNNNGNVTFDSSLRTYTPFNIDTAGRVIMAPFFGDVDTRTNSNIVRYGPDTVGGRDAFGATWRDVTCYNAFGGRSSVVRNDFQLVLTERFDTGAGNFDIEFNYGQIHWDAGTASSGDANCLNGSAVRVGYSDGHVGDGHSFELAGSGVDNAFTDSNTDTGLIYNSINSTQAGRYVFFVREGEVEEAPEPEPPAPSDTTSPTTTTSVSPGPNANGWNNTDVTVSFAATDNAGGSGVKEIVYSVNGGSNVVTAGASASTVISDEGVNTVSYFATDNDDNSSTASTVTVKIDKTDPTITASASPGPNGNGWNNTAVTVSYTVGDALSGVDAGASDSGDDVLSSEGAGQGASGSVTDLAGNSASDGVSGIDIDLTDPTITASASPGPNGNGWNNTAVTVSYTVGDALSGVDAGASDSGDDVLSSEGAGQSASGSVTDLAGNTASDGVSGIDIDLTDPVLSLPPSVVLEATSPDGAVAHLFSNGH